MNNDKALKNHLRTLLRGEDAHLNFESVTANWPLQLQELRGRKPAGAPHTPWKLLEHLRIAQWDILEFIRNARHVSPPFPDGYWPEVDAPPDPDSWDKSARTFLAELQAMEELVTNPGTDLFSRIPHGQGQTVLREALLLADHNAYHLGQLLVVRRLLGAWPAQG